MSWFSNSQFRKYVDTTGFSTTVTMGYSLINSLFEYLKDTPLGFSTFFNDDPLNSITSLRAYPFDISPRGSGEKTYKLKINDHDTNLIVEKPYDSFTVCMANKKITRHFNNFADFNGYTTVQVFLPYYGLVGVDTNDVMDKYLTVFLTIDFQSGQATYYVCSSTTYFPTGIGTFTINSFTNNSKDSRILSIHTFQLGYDIPLGGTNARDIKRNMILNGMRAMWTAGKTLHNFTMSQTSTVGKDQKSYSDKAMGGLDELYNIGMEVCANSTIRNIISDATPSSLIDIGSRNVIIIIYRPKIKPLTQEYKHQFGVPLAAERQLTDLNGYTEIGNIHIEGDGFKLATETEKDMIKNYLESGVIM